MTTAIPTPEETGTTPDHGPGWRADLRLRFGVREGRTRIIERVHDGPLVVQRPYYPEVGGRCHAYIVHPPGGIVGGDELTLRVDVTEGGQALLTTPSATRLYRNDGRTPSISQHLTVSDGSTLEWLPQELIAFDGSDARIETRVILEERATYLGWDILCLGRPAAGERYRRGRLRQRLQVRREDHSLLDELLTLEADGPVLGAPWGLGRRSTLANLVAVAPGEVSAQQLASVRAALPGTGQAAATRVSGALVVRVLSDSAREAHAVLQAAWQVARPMLIGSPPVAPRIWAT
jgi:urease accessory protein